MSRPANVRPSPVTSAPLPEVINHTQWPTQYFQHIDPHGDIFHVMVSRITYSLRGMRQDGDDLPTPSLMEVEDQTPLCEADEYLGAVNESSLLQESDFAPYKPKCDLLLQNAWAYAPDGKPARRWPAGFRFGELQKQFQVTGPRQFERSLTSLGLLTLSEPQAATKVPLTYELAYGGPNIVHSKLKLEDFESDTSLSPEQREHAAQMLKSVPDFDALNPIGCGRNASTVTEAALAVAAIEGANSSADERHRLQAEINNAPRMAPQTEAFDRPYKGEDGEAAYPVIGVGPIARWWQPRRPLAGTHDAAWKQTQWPKSPTDHDYHYWNCAPEDQQMDWPTGGEEIVLGNLTPSGSPVRFLCPRQDLQLLVRLNAGAMMFAPMHIDTVIIDFAKGTLCLVRRALVGARADVRQLELGTWPAGTAMQIVQEPAKHGHPSTEAPHGR